MTVNELSEKYHEQLTSTKGDKELRYFLLSPLFQNLCQNKVVYHERFTAIVQLADISLTPDIFIARAELISLIKSSRLQKKTAAQYLGNFSKLGLPYFK